MLDLVSWLLSLLKLWWQLSPVLSLPVFSKKRLLSCSAILSLMALFITVQEREKGATTKLNTLEGGIILFFAT